MELLHNGQAALVSFTDKVDHEFLIKYPDLKVVGSNTTGNDHIDFKACEERGMKVITLGLFPNRDEETERFLDTITSTAEHTIGLMIALARNYKKAFNGQSSVGYKLSGKTLGLIGYGRIAKQVKKIAEAMGMVVFTNEVGCLMPLDKLLKESDFVSVHIPLTNNEGFITKEMFQMMKASSYFINTSRDGVVEQGALRWSLENGIIAGAAVDFTDSPDLVEYSVTHENLVLVPHIGGATFEDRVATRDFILNKIDNYVSSLCETGKEM